MNGCDGKKYALWLHQCRGISPMIKRCLSEKFDGAENVWRASLRSLSSCMLLKPETAELLVSERSHADPDRLMEDLCEKGIDFVSVEDPEYPARLLPVIDRPFGLYYIGTLPPEDRKSAAIVGARMCSAYGYSTAQEIGYLMAKAGFTVVSGMARGIDSASHKGCLEGGGRTAAVLGCGIDVCYPPENRELYDAIRQRGCILSEYDPGTAPIGKNFPIRNRIISGLSDSVIVVEARIRSGSLITAQMACQQNRNVLVVPGRINDPMSQGANHLIELGAEIIPSIDRLIEKLSEEAGMKVSLRPEKKIRFNSAEKSLLQNMDYYPKSSEDLLSSSGLTYREYLETLYTLSQKGMIREMGRNHYCLV